jgi:cell wall-associated NlpC family hydrolase
VNNDPVNWVDLWGLSASDAQDRNAVSTDLLAAFTDEVRGLVGTPYELGGKSLDGIDCSGVVTYSLNQLGYNVSATSAEVMASGKLDWVTVTSGNSIPQSNPGTLNFYTFGSDTVQHVNVGAGQKEREPMGQIVDATEGSWMTTRNDNPNQIIEAGSGQVNQTFTPFSSKTQPVSQGTINFDVLDAKYREKK